jgi:hypothetical protein
MGPCSARLPLSFLGSEVGQRQVLRAARLGPVELVLQPPLRDRHGTCHESLYLEFEPRTDYAAYPMAALLGSASLQPASAMLAKRALMHREAVALSVPGGSLIFRMHPSHVATFPLEAESAPLVLAAA